MCAVKKDPKKELMALWLRAFDEELNTIMEKSVARQLSMHEM